MINNSFIFKDFGMSPNFWLYILLYCLFLLLIFGLFHTFVVLRYFHSKDIETEPLLKNSNKNANDELTSPTCKNKNSFSCLIFI